MRNAESYRGARKRLTKNHPTAAQASFDEAKKLTEPLVDIDLQGPARRARAIEVPVHFAVNRPATASDPVLPAPTVAASDKQKIEKITTADVDEALERALSRHQATSNLPLVLNHTFAARARMLNWVEGVEFQEAAEKPAQGDGVVSSKLVV